MKASGEFSKHAGFYAHCDRAIVAAAKDVVKAPRPGGQFHPVADRVRAAGVAIDRLQNEAHEDVGRAKVTARSVVRVAFALVRGLGIRRSPSGTSFQASGKVRLMLTAKCLVAAVALLNFGGLVADAIWPFGAQQHMRNPAWPPHAKFHNAQTIVIGIFAGLLSLAILFGTERLTLEWLLVAAATAASYFAAMLIAPLFPGTAWSDPEFAGAVRQPLGLAPQQIVSGVACALVIVAVLLALAS